jgi:hypothetical protein
MPEHVFYDIQRQDLWLPLVRETEIPHPKEEKHAEFESFLERRFQRKSLNEKEHRLRGTKMCQFQQFYGPQQFTAPLQHTEKTEWTIKKTIEEHLRLLRSQHNQNTHFKN